MVLLYSIERLLVVLSQKLSNCKSPLDAKDFGTKGPTSCLVGCYFCFDITPEALRKGFSLQGLARLVKTVRQSNISLLLRRWDTFEADYLTNNFLQTQACGVF